MVVGVRRFLAFPCAAQELGKRYRSLRDVELELGPLNVLIGPNASGKSSVLDALRLLHEAVVERDFSEVVRSRGGIVHLAWKGEDASSVELRIRATTSRGRFEWSVGGGHRVGRNRAPGAASPDERERALSGAPWIRAQRRVKGLPTSSTTIAESCG